MLDLQHLTPDSFTRLDIAVLVMVGLSALWGLTRGLARELSGLAAWVLTVMVTYRFHAALVPWLEPYVQEQWLRESVSAAILFVIVLLLLTNVSNRIGNVVRGTLLGGMDRILGAAFGALRGAVMVIALYLVLGSFFGSWMTYVMQGSLTGPYIRAGATQLAGYLPNSLIPHLASSSAKGH